MGFFSIFFTNSIVIKKLLLYNNLNFYVNGYIHFTFDSKGDDTIDNL